MAGHGHLRGVRALVPRLRHGGFSAGEPWLPAYADAGTIGVDAQRDDRRSFLALYRRLLRLRRALGWGRGHVTSPESTADELVYYNVVDGRRYCVVARIVEGAHTTQLPVSGHVLLHARQLVPASSTRVDVVTLAGPDAVVIELAPADNGGPDDFCSRY